MANYGAGPHDEGPDRGVAVLPLREDGGLGAPAAGIAHRGRGPDALRQERAHPHCVMPSPDGRFVAVVDLGLDAIVTYGYGPDGTLAETPVATLALRPGAGPRHLAFHPDGRLALAICELESSLVLLAYDAAIGRFAPRDTLAAVPAEARQDNHCSDVQIHPGGRFAYAANRGHDSILVMEIDAAGGRLAPVGHQACGGQDTPPPRDRARRPLPGGRQPEQRPRVGLRHRCRAGHPDGGLRDRDRNADVRALHAIGRVRAARRRGRRSAGRPVASVSPAAKDRPCPAPACP